MEALTEELLFAIFSFLDAGALGRAGLVSSFWHRLASDDLLWKGDYRISNDIN